MILYNLFINLKFKGECIHELKCLQCFIGPAFCKLFNWQFVEEAHSINNDCIEYIETYVNVKEKINHREKV